MTLAELNKLSLKQAKQAFFQCCTSSAWVKRMVNLRPFPDINTLKKQADITWQDLSHHDYFEAFEGHPKIGDVNSLREKYASTKGLAGDEQSSVKQADEKTLNALAKGNNDYQEKFGFIFIVCATGKSASQMSELLHKRLINDKSQEVINAAEEQRKIFQIRISKMLNL